MPGAASITAIWWAPGRTVYVASGSGASVVADSVVGASVVAESLSLEQAAKVTIDAKATVTPKIRRVVSDIGFPLR